MKDLDRELMRVIKKVARLGKGCKLEKASHGIVPLGGRAPPTGPQQNINLTAWLIGEWFA